MESKIQLEHLLDETGNSTEQLKGIEYQTQIDIYEPGTHVMYNSFDGPPKSPFGNQNASNPSFGVDLPSGNQMHFYGPNPDFLEGGGYTDNSREQGDPDRHPGDKLDSYRAAIAEYYADKLGFPFFNMNDKYNGDNNE